METLIEEILEEKMEKRFRQLRITSGTEMTPGSTPWIVSLGKIRQNYQLKET